VTGRQLALDDWRHLLVIVRKPVDRVMEVADIDHLDP
jgi:hypothetical protein